VLGSEEGGMYLGEEITHWNKKKERKYKKAKIGVL